MSRRAAREQMQVKEHPLLFSNAMVRAILEGRKTQTRRVIKIPSFMQYLPFVPQGAEYAPRKIHMTFERGALRRYWLSGACWNDEVVATPKYASGDRLWVREAWAQVSKVGGGLRYAYKADNGDNAMVARWCPSIHMPREASRITLEVTEVRVERLQDMDVASCVKEGVSWDGYPGAWTVMAKPSFAKLWDSLYAKRGLGWDANPWVFAYTFKVLEVRK